VWAKYPFLATKAALSQEFKTIIQDRQSRKLEDWIQKTLNMTVPPEFKRFAQGLEKDEAVKAALELAWSNGQVEGQINRLKLIKRRCTGDSVLICYVDESCIENREMKTRSRRQEDRRKNRRKQRRSSLLVDRVFLPRFHQMFGRTALGIH
jgi:hypothetical protein